MLSESNAYLTLTSIVSLQQWGFVFSSAGTFWTVHESLFLVSLHRFFPSCKYFAVPYPAPYSKDPFSASSLSLSFPALATAFFSETFLSHSCCLACTCVHRHVCSLEASFSPVWKLLQAQLSWTAPPSGAAVSERSMELTRIRHSELQASQVQFKVTP